MARRIRTTAALGSVYITSSYGVMKSTSAAADFTQAGLPRCLDLVLALTGAPGTLLTDSAAPGNDQARSYRGVWCIRDANNNLVQSVPSSRTYIVNTAAATRDVNVTVSIPSEITTSHFFQLYASAIVDNGTVVDPGDELRLAIEYFPTSTDITNGTFTVLDNVPDAFRQADLYTNQEQLGIARQFDRPPMCTDMVWFNNKLVVANTTDVHRMTTQMLGTTGMTTQTITLGGVVYTAGTAETASTGTFQVFKAGGGGYTDKGTQSLNVDFTARSLCNVINKYTANTILYAYYVSASQDQPGKIEFEARGLGSSAFTMICSAAAMGSSFSPAIPTSVTTYTSVADRRVNYLRVSESGQPEHMSRVRNIIVGGGDEEIQRILALRGSLIIIKDRSVWRVTEAEVGEAPILLDNTCGIRGRDTASTLNNAVYFLSDQGFVCATENGIQIIGRPVENRVLTSIASATSDYANTNFVGQGHERERYYICSIQEGSELNCYKYSPISNGGRGSWTKRRINPSAFCITNGLLFYALNNTNGHILKQRSSLLDGLPWFRDYCEEEVLATVTNINSSTNVVDLTLTSYVDYDSYNTYVPGFGWVLYPAGTTLGSQRCLVISGVTNGAEPLVRITLDTVTGIVLSSTVSLFRPIPWTIEYSPIAQGNPLELKQFHRVLGKLETHRSHAIDVSFVNQVDTKTSPSVDDWDAQPAAARIYVPEETGAEASSTTSDFYVATDKFNPHNEVVTLVDPLRAQGEHLSVRISGQLAEGFTAIKALVVTLLGSGSKRTRQ